jgi:hypothetical protein
MTSAWKPIVQLAVGALAAALLTLAPLTPADAQNPFESFFSELGRALHAARRPPAFAEPFDDFRYRRVHRAAPRLRPAPTGPTKAFCVRSCDGRYFPVRAHAGLSVAQACHAFCPASKVRIYSGGSIDYAVARDGSRYRDLPEAYAYRKHLVAGCTCNGRDAFGLAPIDVADDPTLRPGDVVATKYGLMAFTGRTGKTANFTPVKSYPRFSKGLRQQLSELPVATPAPQAPDATPLKRQPSVDLDRLRSAQR